MPVFCFKKSFVLFSFSYFRLIRLIEVSTMFPLSRRPTDMPAAAVLSLRQSASQHHREREIL
jgi:hypothetical protein